MKKHVALKKIVVSSAFAGALLATPTLADAALGDQTLRAGMTNSDVNELQDILQDKGYYNYTVDGIYGPITEQAVRDFQRDANIQVDGIAGPQTFGALNINNRSGGSATTASRSSGSSSSSEILRQGDRGSSVSGLQEQLNDLGYYHYTVDGIYGPITVQAVRDFQRAAGIQVDGIAGPQTFGALNDNPSSNNASSSNSSGSTQTASSSSSFNVDSLVNNAKDLIGSPYQWGGTSPSGFDCSGYLNYVFEQIGVSLPRTVAGIWDAGTSVSSPSVGDIVFFETYTSGPSHAGIYLGNNQFIHAGSSTGVTISNMTTNYWDSRYLGAKSY